MKTKTLLLFIIAGTFYVNLVNAQRIITAGRAITETVCALGDCDKIFASDRTNLYPSHIQQLPSIGYHSGINAEGMLRLSPYVIILEKYYAGRCPVESCTHELLNIPSGG